MEGGVGSRCAIRLGAGEEEIESNPVCGVLE